MAEQLLTCLGELKTILADCAEDEFKSAANCVESLENIQQSRIAREQAIVASTDALQKDQLETQRAKQQMENVKSRAFDSKDKVLELRKQCKLLEEKVAESERLLGQQDSQDLSKHTGHLYTSITKIRWENDNDPDVIKGFISNRSGVIPFNLNRREHSQFYITNYIWDLMEPVGERK